MLIAAAVIAMPRFRLITLFSREAHEPLRRRHDVFIAVDAAFFDYTPPCHDASAFRYAFAPFRHSFSLC